MEPMDDIGNGGKRPWFLRAMSAAIRLARPEAPTQSELSLRGFLGSSSLDLK